MFSPKVCVV